MMNCLTVETTVAHALQESYEGVYVDVGAALKVLQRKFGGGRRRMLTQAYLAYHAPQRTKLGVCGRKTVAADYIQCERDGWIRLPGYALMAFVRMTIPN
jgi:hypothetical protein